MPFEPAPALPVSVEQRVELVRLSRSTSLPHRTVVQARGLLLAADGVANEEIARAVGLIRTRCGGGVRALPIRVSAGLE